MDSLLKTAHQIFEFFKTLFVGLSISCWNTLIGLCTLGVTVATLIYMIFKDKKELGLSIVPECTDRPTPTHWYVDIVSLGNRSISISSAKLVLSKTEHKLLIGSPELVMPGGYHNKTERKPLEMLIRKKING